MDFLGVLVDLFVYQAGDADKAVILLVMLIFLGPIRIKPVMLTFLGPIRIKPVMLIFPRPIVIMPVMLTFVGPIVRLIFTANPIKIPNNNVMIFFSLKKSFKITVPDWGL